MFMKGVLDVPTNMIVIIPKGDYGLVYIKYAQEHGIFYMAYACIVRTHKLKDVMFGMCILVTINASY